VNAYSQPVYERHQNTVYDFLSRMSQKGLINWNDNIRPLRKDQLISFLDSLASKEITQVEKNELAFYKKELSAEGYSRKLKVTNQGTTLQLLPIITGELQYRDQQSIFKKSIGAQLYGQVSNKIGYQFSFQDISESGKNLDTSKTGVLAAEQTGMVLQSQRTITHLNYSEIRGGISYAFKRGAIYLGQDYLLWGYGQSGKIVLSDKAPTYPYFRLDYSITPKIKFNYTHAWLKSDIPDSARSYTILNGMFGGVREVFVSKYMASHSLEISLMRGLNFSVGESIIYTDRMNVAYLIPVMFFKAFDNYAGSGSITRGSNGQFFFQLSSRDQLKNTHLFATLLIDEIKISKALNKIEQRNQLGYTVGASTTDVGLSTLTIGTEYTRVRPFVYRNFLPAQNYTSASFLLGDWMGNNADRITFYANYTPASMWRLSVKYNKIRKGSEGTLDQQYLQQPQPPFLFGTIMTYSDFIGKISYQPISHLFLFGSFRHLNSQSIFSAGLNFGL
jgi:hypothetical protein